VGGGASAGFRADGVSFTNTDFFNGEIDELAIYNSALSPARIATHYQVGVTPPLPAGTIAPVTAPVFTGYTVAAGSFTISWTGTGQLQRSTKVAGPYTTVSGAASPYNEPATNQQVFFRLIP